MTHRLRRRLPLLVAALAALALAPAAHAGPVTLVGTVDVAHGDDARTSTTTAYYVLRTPQGAVRVKPARGVRWFPETGDRVRVTGVRRGGTIVASRVQRLGRLRRLLGGTPVTGTRTVAVILVNFTDRQSTPWTAAQLEDRFFDATDSVAAYYHEQSNGKLTITGDVYDWHTINLPSTSCDDWYDWGTAARQAAGVPSTYNHYVYVFPTVPSCGWAGLAYLPGSESWINGYPDLRVMGHELGHNLGVHHASTQSCSTSGARVTLSASCSSPNEYGDPFTIMGSASTFHFNGFHKGQLGWFDAGNEQTATTSGSYTVATHSSGTTGVQSLRIRRSPTEWIYCDLRATSGGFDAFAGGAAATQGVMLRLGPDYPVRTQSRLLDATPATSSFNDAALLPGQTFTDPVTGISITAGAVGPFGASLQVTVPGGTPQDTTPPQAPPALVAQVLGDGGVRLTWSAATDDVGVTAYRVYRDGVQLGTATSTLYTHAAAPPGDATYAVAAVDAAGNVGAQATTTATVPVQPPATPTGVLAIVPPGTATVRLAWAASARAASYRVLRDGVLLATTTVPEATDPTPRPGVQHAYTVVAVDAFGQTSAASAAALVTVPPPVTDPSLGDDPPDVDEPDADDRPPGVPTGLKLLSAGKLRLRLTWKAARDDVGVAYYRVERGGRLVVKTKVRAVLLARRTLSASTTLTVRAVDAAGNVGRPARLVVRKKSLTVVRTLG